MANTTVEFISFGGQTLVAYLTARYAATGTPAASYAPVEVVGQPGKYQFIVPEDLVGEFDLLALEGVDVAVRQFVNLLDDTSIYRGYDYGPDADLGEKLCALRATTQGIAVEVAKIIKSGEEFEVTSDSAPPKQMTFSRV